MTRGRALWLALLTVGFLVALLLRTPSKRRDPDPVPDPRARASGSTESAGPTDEVEVEIADPRELGITPTRPSAGAIESVSTEPELVRALADAWQSDPERALALAEQGEASFGESPRAVERRLYEIKALVKLGRIGRARTKAERYLEKYPPGPMTDEVERLTGVHRRPKPEPAP